MNDIEKLIEAGEVAKAHDLQNYGTYLEKLVINSLPAIKGLHEENKRLRAALEFYTEGWESTGYECSETGKPVRQLWSTDNGETARQALRGTVNPPQPEKTDEDAAFEKETKDYFLNSQEREILRNALRKSVNKIQEQPSQPDAGIGQLIEDLIDNYPHGHITVCRLTNGKISIAAHNGLRGSGGRVDYRLGDTFEEALKATPH